MHSNFKDYSGIKSMADKVLALQSDPKNKKIVDERMDEFRWVHNQDSIKWYKELVYCLLTAYSSALLGQKCLDALCCDNILLKSSLKEVQACLQKEGHRFANRRGEYIYNTRKLAPKLKFIIQGFRNSKDARVWLVKNIKGIGWKEASHYLRNVGYFNLAIIDRHILSNMEEHDLIKATRKKGITAKRYFKYEKILNMVAKRLDMPLGELDLYLWYRKTGKVLK
jgi:N-glycosylase/DNA lyase